MQTYQRMKDSNVAWLGSVPAEWGQKRAKYLFTRSQQKPHENDGVVTAFRDGEVILRSLRRSEGFTFADKEIGYQHVEKGDLVIHAMDAFAGAIGVSKSDGKMSPVCSICKPRNDEVDPTYYSYLLRAMTKTNWLVAIAKGIRERSTDFRYGDFGNMLLPLPPIQAQRSIVSCIDQETAQIDDLITKQQYLLYLLEEKRRAIVSSAVTVGVSRDAKTKHTGVVWQPTINKNWTLTPLKQLLRLGKNAIKTGPFGSDVKNSDFVSEELGHARVYTQANIINENLSLNPVYITKKKYKSLASCTIEAGDIVMTSRGTLGKSLIFSEGNELGILHPSLIRVQLDDRKIKKEFFQLLANDAGYFIDQLKYISNSTTIDVLYGNNLAAMKIALPHLSEQAQIVEHAHSTNAVFSGLNSRILEQIELLKERRASLISHIVTGKAKV